MPRALRSADPSFHVFSDVTLFDNPGLGMLAGSWVCRGDGRQTARTRRVGPRQTALASALVSIATMTACMARGEPVFIGFGAMQSMRGGGL